ncbi:PLP-dependent aminotransferase family protein [Bailinhaonella thermotolerans]|uniref:PLP-dependent aminotransferase family protein n=1 Tax=Bailinhaonella thermotolerans TaxID=1070861 RepID=A0A3A4AZI4_9ACTN|nr:PLP-dependent aminotransferase family protein [Bailinhaonella thermotolerans]RJL35797.1 PLP-dependent aminotransferase family protein [Bailinhaonella thermotolerans]
MNRSRSARSDRSNTAAGSDFLQLDAGEAPPGGIADWLALRLRGAIAEGLLPVGSRLPATRVLAADLRVSRGVVTEAYRRLAEDGHVAGRGRAGTVVVAVPPAVPEIPPGAPPYGRPPGAPPYGRPRPAARTPARSGGEAASPAGPFAGAPGDDVFEVMRALPARIDLSPGLPDLAAFPRAAWLRAERAVLAGLPSTGFGYGDPRGAPELRRAVANWLARNRGIRADPDEVLIVSGTAQALGLFARVLTARGLREVAVEDPGSLGARQHLLHWGLRTPPIPVDDDGVRADLLLARGAPAVLLTPAHQFPTGVVLSGARRRALMRWAGEGGLIIEDDYDAEHRYDRPPVPALRSVLPDRVWYAGSASKLLAPALRVGWVLVPREHHDDLVAAKRFADLGNAVLPQLVLARLMESGELERHLRFLRRRHRRRRDAMIGAIRAHLPGALVHGAAAGLHLTITFEHGPGDVELAAAALERGIKVHPLSWHAQRPGRPGLVLGYAASPPTAITEAIAVLGELLSPAPPRRAAPRWHHGLAFPEHGGLRNG